MKLFYFANIYLTNNLFVNKYGESGITFSDLRNGMNPCGFSSLMKSLVIDSFAERAGFEPAVRLPVRQFSKLVVLATHPSLQWFKELGGKISKSFDKSKEY